MTIVEIHLTNAQRKRLEKGLAIRLGSMALQGYTSLSVSEALAKKIESSRRRGKGLTLKPEDINFDDSEGEEEDEFDGGRIRIGRAFKKIGKSFNKATKTVAREATRDIRVIRREAPGAIKQGSHEVGKAVQQSKKYIPKELIAIPLVAATTVGATMASGNPMVGAAAGRAMNSAVNATYQTNLAHGSVGKNWATNFGKDLVVGEVKNQFKVAPPVAGSGFKPIGGGRLAKGSQAAKDYMASIRAKRYTGAGVVSQVRSHVRDIEGRARSGPNNISLTMEKDSVGGDWMTREFQGRGFLPI